MCVCGFTGHSAYHIILECGNQMHMSKTSKSYHGEIHWNEKHVIKFPTSKWESLSYLKLKISHEKHFTDGDIVGETMINLKGIIVEGIEKGVIEVSPTLFNVVLDDDSYKGEIKIGLKFLLNKQVDIANVSSDDDEHVEARPSIHKNLRQFWRMLCWRFLFMQKHSESDV
ncbi:elicitor-responsive protein 3 [Impatiens glandulifera]|uniref:elicitor-responsive protein 3 n=1 Tax=Impatiens glandulifera TaxID=253017 RepID=UPI001FB17D91|nr:elicitor-responsive protein 3 [Impatiens glandulifera]